MRDIKFRAWDGREMFYDVTIANGRYITVEDDGETLYYWHDRSEQVDIMQYTGLKDKNGTEIYEGDICQVAGNRVYEIRYIDKAQVNSDGFETYGACFVLWISEELFFPFDEYAMEHGKVIGNIHKNPELLNK